MHSKVMCRYLKRAASSGTGLFKNQRYILACEVIMSDAFFLLFLQLL